MRNPQGLALNPQSGEIWESERRERIRDVRSGRDGWLYVLTNEANVKLLDVGME